MAELCERIVCSGGGADGASEDSDMRRISCNYETDETDDGEIVTRLPNRDCAA
jgi:hypothetical protein